MLETDLSLLNIFICKTPSAHKQSLLLLYRNGLFKPFHIQFIFEPS